MATLIASLRAAVAEAIAHCYPELADVSPFVLVTSSTKPRFGDYQCNSAMSLAKPLKQSPRAIAEQLLSCLASNNDLFKHIDIAGPGFINMHVADDMLLKSNINMFNNNNLCCSSGVKKERVVVDYSSPNVAKDMHVGHLRSTVIGDCLARVFRYVGHDVLALNHIGDWGTAFGMLICYLEDVAPKVLRGAQPADAEALLGWYREAKQRFDNDEAFKRQSQQAVVALQGGDKAKRQAWQHLCELSRAQYQGIYDLLDVHLEERGESFYQPFLAQVVADLKDLGLLTMHEGAACVFLEDFKNRQGDPLPFMVQKSDGGYNYATTDLAALKHRVQQEQADRIIYVVDAGQSTHFAMLFEVAKRAAYVDPNKVELAHVAFGLVLGEDGKKFRTRSGHTEKLMDLLQEGVHQAKTALQQRTDDWAAEDIDATAAILGLGAVKYADLSVNRASDYVFSYEKMLRMEGNTATFVMYAYVRLLSILRQLPQEAKQIEASHLCISHPTERALALHLSRFAECLHKVIQDYAPNRLTDYCYQLAEHCHAFHRDCRVKGSDMQVSRLAWCELSRRTLCASLALLGIGVPTRM